MKSTKVCVQQNLRLMKQDREMGRISSKTGIEGTSFLCCSMHVLTLVIFVLYVLNGYFFSPLLYFIRAGREFLGITIKDISKRPLVYRTAIYGLTGTPLLDSSNRVIELANLMGNAYVLGLSSHWRRLEKESTLDVACCRNKVGADEMNGSELVTHHRRPSISPV